MSTSVVEAPWWVLQAIRPAQLGRQLEQAHWQFFFVPPDVRAKAFGFGRTSALARALRKILAKADLAGLNTVEIASITAQELLGIQFACIEARLRHIQQGLVLTPEKQGTKPSGTTGLRPPSPQAVRGESVRTSTCERVARLPAARPTGLQSLRTRSLRLRQGSYKRASQSQERPAPTPCASTPIVRQGERL